MIKKVYFLVFSFFITFLMFGYIDIIPPAIYANQKQNSMLINLNDSSFTDENIYKYHDINLIRKAPVLIDDKDKMPSALTKETKLPAVSEVVWKPVFGQECSGAVCRIDLGKNFVLTDIAIFDSFGSPNVIFQYGTPFIWQQLFSVNLTYFKQWQIISVANISTRYIRIIAPAESGFSEIALYGYEDTTIPQNPPYGQEQKYKETVTADKAFGVNAFVDDPLQVSKVAGTIREFHNVSFSYMNGKNYFAPSANNAWNFDDYYKSLNDNNIDVMPCIQGTTKDISGDIFGEDFSGNEKPLPPGANPEDPMSYEIHSNIMFNYAARYGNKKISTDRLNLASNQIPKTGLGYIKYYENFNEGNKDWEGEKSYFTPFQFAAMCSADYDGHEKKLGENYGIKNADPSSKLVMGGLVGRNVIEYVSEMKFWFENNRADKKFAVDVINLHYYIRTEFTERNAFLEDMKQLKAYVDKYLPGTEIWVTEFGPEIPKTEIEDRKSERYLEAKGNATVRQFLLSLEAGIDRMNMFMLRDTAWGVYEDDGLTTMKGLWEPKPSWHYVYGTRTALFNMIFDSVEKKTDEIYIYKFKDTTNANRIVYALWTPDNKQRTFTLPVNNKKSVILTQLAHGYAEGKNSILTAQNNSVALSVSARPIFVTLYNNKGIKPNSPKERLSINSITGDNTLLGRIKVMFDEQDKTPFTPTLKAKQEFENYEQDPGYISAYPNLPELSRFPMTAVIDLGNQKTITDVGFYDSNATGNIVLYYMDFAGKWNKFLSYGLDTYQFWKICTINQIIKTRFIKIEKYNLAACYEMALYGY